MGRRPSAELVVADDGRLTGTLGAPELDAALVAAATGSPRARAVADGRARRSIAVHRGLPGPAAARRRRWRRGRPLARPSRARARVRDGRRRRPGRVRDDGALPRGRPPRRRLAGRGRRRDRARPERRGRGPVPRRQVRRAGHRRGAPPRLPVRRRGRVAQDPGRPPRAPARGGRQRGGAGAPAWPGRARPRRSRAGRDRARDPGRDRRRALRRDRRADARAGARDGLSRQSAGPPDARRTRATSARPRCDDAVMSGGTVGLVLAAGAGSRFGGGKLLAPIGGRPILQHVLDALATAGLDDVVVVLGRRRRGHRSRDRVADRAAGRQPGPRSAACRARCRSGSRRSAADAGAVARRARRPAARPGRGHPALLDAPADPARPIVVPAYPDDRGRNPVLLRRAAFDLVAEATGDRGLGPVIAAHPELVAEVPVAGANPDVDTPADLARVDRGRLGAPASGPTASRSSGSARSPTAPTSTPRSTRSSGPTRPGPTTRSSTRCSRLVAVGRYVARRRRRRRTVRAADRSRARPVGRRGHRARRVAVDARGRCARSPRTTRSRTSGPSRRAGRRPTRSEPPRSMPTSPSSPTSATTSRRSGRSSTRSRRRPARCASPS